MKITALEASKRFRNGGVFNDIRVMNVIGSFGGVQFIAFKDEESFTLDSQEEVMYKAL